MFSEMTLPASLFTYNHLRTAEWIFMRFDIVET